MRGQFANTIGNQLRRTANNHPNRTGFVDQDRSFTWQEFNLRVNKVANSFLQIGAQYGDMIVSMLSNSHHVAELYYATSKAGFTGVPLNPRLNVDETIMILNKVKAENLVIDSKYTLDLPKICAHVRTLKNVITVNLGNQSSDIEHTDALSLRLITFMDYEAFIAGAESQEPNVDVNDEDLATILFTSGTTGVPKGVMRTQANNSYANISSLLMMDYTAESIQLQTVPMFGIAFFMNVSPIVTVGGTCIILRRFDEKKCFEITEKHRVTHLYCVPTMWNRLLNSPYIDKYDLSSLKYLYGSVKKSMKTT